jgi:hypothetical protein
MVSFTPSEPPPYNCPSSDDEFIAVVSDVDVVVFEDVATVGFVVEVVELGTTVLDVVDTAVVGVEVVEATTPELVVLVVVAALVVEVVSLVCVVPANEMAWLTWSPPWSPNEMAHESPSAIWAAVGGHGYSAASVSASLPALSVPSVGGPSTPVSIVKDCGERTPAAEVEVTELIGSEHPTGTAFPTTSIVGWSGLLLHSTMPPVDLATKPEPDTETTSPLCRSVLGVTLSVPTALTGPLRARTPNAPKPRSPTVATEIRANRPPRDMQNSSRTSFRADAHHLWESDEILLGS